MKTGGAGGGLGKPGATTGLHITLNQYVTPLPRELALMVTIISRTARSTLIFSMQEHRLPPTSGYGRGAAALRRVFDPYTDFHESCYARYIGPLYPAECVRFTFAWLITFGVLTPC